MQTLTSASLALAWTSFQKGIAYLDARDYQWNEVAIPFWKPDGPGQWRHGFGFGQCVC